MTTNSGMRITGAGIAQLAHHQTNEELAPRLGMSASEIEAMTGVRARFVGPDDMTLPELHALACRDALGDGGPPDLIINASVGFHQLIPDTSVFIQRELGYEGICSFSMHGTCISFLHALSVADAHIRSGNYRRVLVTSAEFNTRVRDFRRPESAALLGDAGAALVFEPADDPSRGVEKNLIRAWPKHAELTEVRGFGLRKHPLHEDTVSEDYLFSMDGPGVLRAASKLFLVHMAEFFQSAGITQKDVDLIVPHQPSGKGLRFLAKAGFAQERTVNVLAEYGNCAAVSMPLAMAIAFREGLLRPNERVLLLGTAAGLSVGSMLLRG